MRLTLGIDPGLSGGLAWIGNVNECELLIPMPILDKRPDLKVLKDKLERIRPDLVVIEKPGNRPGQSAQSGMTAGVNWGLVVGLVTALEIPIIEVTPQTWKKEFGIVIRRAKGEPKLTPKQVKEKSIAMAQRLYPRVNLLATPRCSVPHDGMAEALLIATYGHRIGK